MLAHHNVRRIGIDVAPEISAAPVEAPDDKPEKSAKATAAGSGPVKHPAPVAPPANGKRPNA